jgi:hypothetical protein
MSGRPRSRASNARSFLELLEELEPGMTERLRAALPPPILQGILDSAATDWLDVEEINGPFVTQIVLELGPERATAAWRRYVAERLAVRPAFRAIVDGAASVFGLGLGAALRVFPIAFQQAYRDCAEVRVTQSAREATIVLDLAPEFARFEAYGALLRGVFLGMADLTKAKASLAFEPDFVARRVRARLRW